MPVIKGQSMAAYDPRAIQGMAVTYATSPMGGDHTAGWVVDQNLEDFGGTLDRFSAAGQAKASREAQINMAAGDWTGMGLKVLKAERAFNRKAGFSNQADRLPRMFYEEPLPPHNKVVAINDEEVDTTFDF